MNTSFLQQALPYVAADLKLNLFLSKDPTAPPGVHLQP